MPELEEEGQFLPKHHATWSKESKLGKPRKNKFLPRLIIGLFCITFSYIFGYHLFWTSASNPGNPPIRVPFNFKHILSRCDEIQTIPGPPKDFEHRTQSDRFVNGTQPVLIRNATLWTGRNSGKDVIFNGAILLDKGLIKWIGEDIRANEVTKKFAGLDIVIIDAEGSWVTPGIVDAHNHAGVGPLPQLSGAQDTNSLHGITQPFLRSLDGIHTHDESYALMIAGGVTSVNILPGSANAIGGQAFPIKLRPTKERSTSAMLVEQFDSPQSSGWRQMKHACGENPSGAYSGTRMDTIWAFREIYDEAKQLVEQQDKVCTAAKSGNWNEAQTFPENLRLEALTDVLRGKVKVHTHCYEAVDLDAFVRLSNEFKFAVAAFHHASEAYLVPDLLKKAYGTPPAVALFATFSRYKREAYRGSEFAARILHDDGLRVIMKSDHSFPINARYLLHEAQQVFYFGLPSEAALQSVTTTPADVLGLGHRIGYINEGYDADVVIWDSHPLALGATPKQVYIDGIAQLPIGTNVIKKPDVYNEIPRTPNFDREAADAVKYEGLPPLIPSKQVKNLIFKNVKNVWLHDHHDGVNTSQFGIKHVPTPMTAALNGGTDVVIRNGEIVHVDSLLDLTNGDFMDYDIFDLEGGSLAPSLTTFGSPLGLTDIILEDSTGDGTVLDPLTDNIPSILREDATIIRAVDGLQFGSRDALLAYRSGVSTGIVAPSSNGVFLGLGTAFSTGMSNKVEHGAVLQHVTAVHVAIARGTKTSVSSQITALRRAILGTGQQQGDGDEKEIFRRVRMGEIPLVVNADSADVIATIISLKDEVETDGGGQLKLTISGAAEAHLLANELGQANIGVIFTPLRVTPLSWDQRRALAGPPLTNDNALGVLRAAGVTVALGSMTMWPWTARNHRFEIAWAAIMNPDITKAEALALGSINVEKLLGVNRPNHLRDMVAYHGDIFDLSAKAVGVISPVRGLVELF
ncbi:hypothetical protein Clacol_000862 [Clathrus columnatus]|uniref:Amidohydrolase-related domain-containing protein n=1 Tax=Clathrus columnatus TaxID=1419009 RepID=A0AAV4ZZG5_9AGAM|nr:hypothetical protein Clacol_000862 [Clathrus columnatus]